MELASLLRPLATLAGPAAVLALGSFVTALVVTGEDGLEASPLATASSALLLVAMLGVGAAALAALVRLREADRGTAGPAVAVLGSVLVAGGTWASLFVMPALASNFPEALEVELAEVVVGYIASYLVFSVGWVWTGVALRRSGVVPGWLGVLVIVAGVAAFVPSPEPARLLLMGIAVSLLAARLAPAPATAATVPAAAR
ncbi:hypothetical protein [Blastococcus sp. CCUG 61487]|uniref:hypothetical protein n=1 Tax=Blastococcus sp. CCUG 61487 TaxID=1840703 RepID=UPI0010C0669E|nr:hypothetical protein [Blastococcus sp. CCUG 61487]TKJ27414.1 hypothetical protein A6V29_03390 [Blastococcus sp. CCUG 61487]